MPLTPRLLSIGEFAAATQLSPKALRLYDEQQLLPPARIDTANGYRYYASDQVQRGRLIRALRDAGMTLADIAAIVAVDQGRAGARLAQLSREHDRRYAREKRALQAAMLMLHRAPATDLPQVIEQQQPAGNVAVRGFIADRHSFVERFRSERLALERQLAAAQLEATARARCALLDPVADEEGRFEVVLPVANLARVPDGILFRQVPAARWATIVIEGGSAHASELAAATDTLFDWFDRSGHRALGAPLVALGPDAGGLRIEVSWAWQAQE